ncbi:ROK family protein [Calidithermus chliarophilus]|uniref:ROK family protein n=1 Tax=Calidithermus chliarophilus TaxID=52023 RepID=UPI000424F96A|nr:ROK family protein [Calidithermus chliarophilus]
MKKPVSVRTGSNLTKVRAENLSVVLDALRKLQPISRADLAEATALTSATITYLVDELLELGLIEEQKATSKQVGRRPTLLTLRGAAGKIVGLEVSRSVVRGILTDLGGRILKRMELAHRLEGGVDETLSLIHKVIQTLLEGEGRPVGIGVGIPGPVDTAGGVVLEPTNFVHGWRNVPLGPVLAQRWGVPVWLDDDAKTAALGERWYGAGQGVENLLYVSLRSGVGAGLIVRDRLYRGTHELAGEIGHTTINVDGPRCGCGNHGCAETYVSVPAIVQYARSQGLPVSDPQSIQNLALLEDPVALAVKQRTYHYLAAVLVNAVNHYDPDLIILGGTLVRAWPDLCVQVSEKVRGRSFGFLSKDVRIIPAQLGEHSASLGAVALVVEQVIRNPKLVQSAAVPDYSVA